LQNFSGLHLLYLYKTTFFFKPFLEYINKTVSHIQSINIHLFILNMLTQTQFFTSINVGEFY